jgi:hypothetical protein
MVKCISRNDRFPECRECVHRERHEHTELCESKITCVIATSRMLKGWCKTVKPPAPPKPRVYVSKRIAPAF